MTRVIVSHIKDEYASVKTLLRKNGILARSDDMILTAESEKTLEMIRSSTARARCTLCEQKSYHQHLQDAMGHYPNYTHYVWVNGVTNFEINEEKMNICIVVENEVLKVDDRLLYTNREMLKKYRAMLESGIPKSHADIQFWLCDSENQYSNKIQSIEQVNSLLRDCEFLGNNFSTECCERILNFKYLTPQQFVDAHILLLLGQNPKECYLQNLILEFNEQVEIQKVMKEEKYWTLLEFLFEKPIKSLHHVDFDWQVRESDLTMCVVKNSSKKREKVWMNSLPGKSAKLQCSKNIRKQSYVVSLEELLYFEKRLLFVSHASVSRAICRIDVFENFTFSRTRELFTIQKDSKWTASTPSICVKENHLLVNIRVHNYRIYPNVIHGDWTLSEGELVVMDKEMNILSQKTLKVECNYEWYEQHYQNRGIEDLRLIYDKANKKCISIATTHCTHPTTTKFNICKFLYNQDTAALESVTPLYGVGDESCQKNWSLIEDEPQKYVYGWDPILIVKECDESGCVEKFKVGTRIPFARGSSQVIKVCNTVACVCGCEFVYMSMVHYTVPFEGRFNYIHRLVILDTCFNPIFVTFPFKFFNNVVEFCCGIAILEEKLYISFSLNDHKSFVGMIELENLWKKFYSFEETRMGNFIRLDTLLQQQKVIEKPTLFHSTN